MLLAAQHSRGSLFIHIGVFKDAQLEFRHQNPAAGVGQTLLVHAFHQLTGGTHARAAQDVRAGVGSPYKVQAPVGLDNARIAQFAAQKVGHDRCGLIGGILHRIAAQVGDGRVPVGHDGRHARLDSCLKAGQMQVDGILLNGQRSAVHTVGLCPGAREVLDRGDDGILREGAAALQRLHGRHNQRLHHIGVLGVAFLIAAPAGIGNQVRIGAERHAHAHGHQFCAQHLVELSHQFRIAHGPLVDFIR